MRDDIIEIKINNKIEINSLGCFPENFPFAVYFFNSSFLVLLLFNREEL